MTTTVPQIRTSLPGPKAKAIIERDGKVVSPSYTRDYPLVIGQGTWVIDANEEMWKFFSDFSLPADNGN